MLIIIIFILLSGSANAQDREYGPYFEFKTDLTDTTKDVTAEQYVKLYYDTTSYFRYKNSTQDTTKYFRAKIGNINYPTGIGDTVIPVGIANIEDINERPFKHWTDGTTEKDMVVGSIPGTASVSPTGGGIYTIPINLPPGTNGMAPNISLMYNSQSGNGLMGWGWNISGLSSISRTGKIRYFDNTFDGIKFDNTDKLAIDGQRLFNLNEDVGLNNAMYSPEVGNSIRIVLHDVSLSGCSWFESQNKNGIINEYGRSVTSKLETENGVINWFINKTYDPNGNYIEYEYGNCKGEVYIKSISYTGNSNAGLKPYYKIDFNYVRRNDENYTYVKGTEIGQTVILNEIRIKYNGHLIKKYVLNYRDNNMYTQLYSIIEYGENGERYNSTIFEYNNDVVLGRQWFENFYFQYITELSGLNPWDIEHRFGDFNGDKIADRILIRKGNDNNKSRWFLEFGTYQGKDEVGAYNPNWLGWTNKYTMTEPPDGYFQFETVGNKHEGQRLLVNKIQILDINLDGNDDIIVPYLADRDEEFYDEYLGENDYDELKIRIYLSNGSKLIFEREFNVFWDRLKRDNNYEPDECDINESLIPGDYNGDGFPELLVKSDHYNLWIDEFGGFHVDKSNGPDVGNLHYFNLIFYLNGIAEVVSGIDVKHLLTLDKRVDQVLPLNFNSNNKYDIMIASGDADIHSGIFELNNNSDGLNQLFNDNFSDFKKDYKYYLGDFNGDGLTDLFYYKKDNGYEWEIRYCKGDGFTFPTGVNNFNYGEPKDLFGQNPSLLVQDFNGDGKSDLLWYYVDCGSQPYMPYYNVFYSFSINQFKHKELDVEPVDVLNNETGCWEKPMEILDLNGDGNNDIYNLYNDAFANCILSLNFLEKDLFLQNIYDGFNNKTTFTYEPMSKGTDDYGNPNPYKRNTESPGTANVNIGGGGYVVSKIEQFTATDHINAKQSVSYQYEGGISNLDGKGFLGYRKLINSQTDEKGTIKNESIFQPYSPASTLQTFYKYNDKTYRNNEPISEIQYTSTFRILGNKRYLTFQNQVLEADALNCSMKATVIPNISTDVDEFENINKMITYYTDLITIDQTTTIENEYIYDLSYKNWKIFKLNSNTVTQDIRDDNDPGSGSDPDGYFVNKTSYQYYGPELGFNIKHKYDASNISAYNYLTNYGYDVFGNMINETKVDKYDYSKNRLIKTQYNIEGRFPIFTQNAEYQTIVFDYNKYFGLVNYKKDINGNISTKEYDGFGNLIKEINPDGNESTTGLNWYSLTDGATEPLYFKKSNLKRKNASDAVKEKNYKKSYFDSWGRNILNESPKFIEDYTTLTPVYTSTEYYNDGRINKKYLPYLSLTTKNKYQEYEYDNYLRVTKITEKGPGLDNISTTTEYKYNGNPKTTKITSPGNKVFYKTINNAGKTVYTEDNNGNVTHFYYHDNGEINKITITPSDDASNVATVTIDYDELGRKISIVDPDAGTIYYDYNRFGDVDYEESPLEVKNYFYDDLGRMKRELIIDKNNNNHHSEILYYYYGSGNGNGNIRGIYGPKELEEASNTYVEYTYYPDGKIQTKKEVVGGEQFLNSYTYNDDGSLYRQTYPSGIITDYTYDELGFNKSITRSDKTPNEVVWKLKEMNEYGKMKKINMSDDKIETIYDYDDYNYLQGITTNTPNPEVCIQNLDYTWDHFNGHLTSRKDILTNNEEVNITYDGLNRLTSYTTNNVTTDISYYEDGSLKEKKIITSPYDYTYTYNYIWGDPPSHLPHQHATKSITAVKGFMQNSEQNINYTSFNKVKSIDNSIKFYYGYDKQRRKVEYYSSSQIVSSKYFIDNYEKTVTEGSSTKEITYLSAKGGIFSAIVKTGEVENTYYILKDHLGSIYRLVKPDGSLINCYTFSFDPWGKMRNPFDWKSYDITSDVINAFNTLGRGFTGHEHIFEKDLINMNGRIYEPSSGQFLQPDNFVQFPDKAGSYNRYVYVNNNPLSYVDPDGNFAWFLPIIIGAAIGGTIGGLTNPHSDGGFWYGFAKGFTLGAVGGAIGAGGAALGGAFGISGIIPGGLWGGGVGAVSSGVVGGLNNVFNHKDFGEGFRKSWYWGAATGFVAGAISGGLDASANNKDTWWGTTKTTNSVVPNNVIKPNLTNVETKLNEYTIKNGYRIFSKVNYLDMKVSFNISGDHYSKFNYVQTLDVTGTDPITGAMVNEMTIDCTDPFNKPFYYSSYSETSNILGYRYNSTTGISDAPGWAYWNTTFGRYDNASNVTWSATTSLLGKVATTGSWERITTFSWGYNLSSGIMSSQPFIPNITPGIVHMSVLNSLQNVFFP
ncbi:MAG: hypothetical protein EPN82_14595 [Bacteroidetes bacterium]|nr:MAG: hypothetical protein EPN82_14595 [Bacteroidota bacterium]